MILLKESTDSAAGFEMRRPHINAQYMNTSKETTSFYEYDAVVNQLFGGYVEETDDSYEAELAKKYPLTGE